MAFLQCHVNGSVNATLSELAYLPASSAAQLLLVGQSAIRSCVTPVTGTCHASPPYTAFDRLLALACLFNVPAHAVAA